MARPLMIGPSNTLRTAAGRFLGGPWIFTGIRAAAGGWASPPRPTCTSAPSSVLQIVTGSGTADALGELGRSLQAIGIGDSSFSSFQSVFLSSRARRH